MIQAKSQQLWWQSDSFCTKSLTKYHEVDEMQEIDDSSTVDLTVADDDVTAHSNTAVMDLVENYERTSDILKSRKMYSLFDLLDSLLLCAFFSNTTIFEEEDTKGKPNREKTVVKVTATAFPRQKSRTSDEYREYMNIDMLRRKSCAFVGEVNQSNQFKHGTMVTALKKYPINTRFIAIRSEDIVALPPKLDPGEASAVLSTYLPAFGMLHHGSRKRDIRHSASSLMGKKILVVGGDVAEQEALIKLSFLGGADNVSVLPVLQDGPKLERRRFGRVNLNILPRNNAEAVLSQLEESMDLVIDLSFPFHFEHVKSTLKPSGRLVARKNEPNRNILVRTVSNLTHQMALFWVPNGFLYDYDCLAVNHNEDLKVC